MTPQEIIEEVRDSAGEWLEMSECPADLMAGILATKIVSLNNYIEYLERRLKHGDVRKVNIN